MEKIIVSRKAVTTYDFKWRDYLQSWNDVYSKT
jgi:hypothetical protein